MPRDVGARRHLRSHFVVSQGVAGGRRHRRSSSLTSYCGTSPCATSSTEPLHRVVGRRRMRRHRRSLSLRLGKSQGATSTAESFRRVGRRGCSTSLHRAAGRRRARRHRQVSFTLCGWTLPGALSSEVLRRSSSSCLVTSPGATTFRGVMGHRRARRHQKNPSLCHGMSGLGVIGGVFFVVSQDVAGRTSTGSTSSAESLTSCRGTWPCVTSSTEPLHCVVGCGRVPRHWRRPSLRRGKSPGATSTAESFRRVGRRQCSTSSTEPFVVPRDVAVHDVIDGISFVVWLDVAGRVVISGSFRRVTGRRRCCIIRGVCCCATGCRGSTSFAESFRRYRKASPGERRRGSTSSAEFLSYVVLRDVAVRDVIYGASLLCCGTSPGATSSAESIVVLQDVAGLRVSSRIAGSRRVQRSRWGLFVLLDVAGLDVIDGPFRRAAGRRRV